MGWGLVDKEREGFCNPGIDRRVPNSWEWHLGSQHARGGIERMSTTHHNASASDSKEIQRMVSSAREQGKPDRYTGKRRWPRFSAGMKLEVSTDPSDPSASAHVTMQNLSEGGFAFWSKRDLRQHVALFVREFATEEEGEWVSASVRHCTVGIRGYLIGAEFDHPPADGESGGSAASS